MEASSYSKTSGLKIPVVINADDFGFSSEVNAAIADGIRQGCVSSATIMANGEAVEEALGLAQHLKQASFGVHLNLTEFRPVLPSPIMTSLGLMNRDGFFRGNELRQLRPTPQLLEVCFAELDQQLKILLSKGLSPSHLDSHHHVHTIPWLLPVIFSLQRKYRIFKLRTTMNVYGQNSIQPPSNKLLLAKKIWEVTAKVLGSKMTQRFTSLQIFMDDPNRLEFTSARSIELMCHPGQKGFEAETQRLFACGTKVLPSRYQLLNYNQDTC